MASKGRPHQRELLPFAREVVDVPVSEELGDSFLAYSLSVITSRAIPDVRDGLKPVQRRILFSMREMRLYPDRPHRKCAHVVGDVMAKFHPHGDSAIYDTLVRLGQDFSRPVTLIDPQGNFGSLDDPPAAYRYTECRLTPAALDLLGEIDEETVEFRPTYDGESTEPAYLPAVLPNLLVNGTTGIAVGMATNMPTHNLVEVYEAIKLVMSQRRPRPTIDQIMEVLPGPDFATGGIIVDDDLRTAYETGRGTFRIRAKAEIVDVTRARQGLVVTELPYLVGAERVIAKIKELVNNGKLSGIADVKNLSDRKSGLRLVIECKTGIRPDLLLQKLYKLTPLEESFGINNVVLVNGVPTTLGIYDLCNYYITHRLDMVVKRSEFRLRQATAEMHKLDGFIIAIDNIDLVVSIIRNAANTDAARLGLMEQLKISEIQANYILELRLRRLTTLAYDEIVARRTELQDIIAKLERILGSEQRQRTIVIKELGEIANKYGHPRRSQIIGIDEVPVLAELEQEVAAEMPDDPCVVTLSTSGVIGREPLGSSKSYSPGRHDVVQSTALSSLRDTVLAITSTGRVLHAASMDLPEVGGRSRGRDASEVFGADRGETILAIFDNKPEGDPLVLVTSNGMVKRLERSILATVTHGRIAMKLLEPDKLVSVASCNPSDEIIMVSSDAQILRTPVSTISTQGAGAKGVAGMGLRNKARVVGAGMAAEGGVIIAITNKGTAKATDVAEIPSKGRGGGGVRLMKFRDESRIDYAWVGRPERIVAIVGQADAPTKPEAAPQSVGLRPTRRDGAAKSMVNRILQVGTLRW